MNLAEEDDQDEKDYNINLKRFVRHEKVFPWRFIVKVIIGLALVAFVYYLTKEMVSNEQERNNESDQGIEVDVELQN